MGATWGRQLDTILWTTQSLGQHLKMAFICVETKAEALMVKLLSSINQIVLIYCFVMMLIADMIRAESEEDYAFQEGDDDESFLMERADAVSRLLPCLAVLTMGIVVASGGGRVLFGIQQ